MINDTTAENPVEPLSHNLPKWEIRGTEFALFIALLFSCMGLTSSLFASVADSLLETPAADVEPPLLIALAANLGLQVGMLIGFLGFKKILSVQGSPLPLSSAQINPGKAAKIGLKWLLYAYPVMIAVNLISRSILNLAGFEQVIQDPIRMVQEGGTNLELAIMFSMIVLVAPICEEVAFRGGIFRYLHHRLPLYASIGISAFLFALLHANLYSFAPLMTIGVMLALAYRESGSLLSCITFHAVFNSINLVLILLFPDLT